MTRISFVILWSGFAMLGKGSKEEKRKRKRKTGQSRSLVSD